MPFLKSLKYSETKRRTEDCRRNGLRCAIFTPSVSSKKRYTGEWRDDKKNGKGSEYQIQSCLVYEGDWSNDARHGYGVLSKILQDKHRRKIYSGYWVNGKKEGFGGFWYENGDYYEGYFLGNKRHGFGRMWKSEGTFYQGTWKNDLLHGEGMLVLGRRYTKVGEEGHDERSYIFTANGNRFEGHFSCGKREGQGIFYHMRTGQLQEGCWLADICLAGTIEDTYWRQSAEEPTPYPIPKSKLKNSTEIMKSRINRVSLLCDPAAYASSKNYQDYDRGHIDCP